MEDHIVVDGLKTAYKISGLEDESAPVAVILQGWGTTYKLYDVIAGLLGDRYRVVQFDLPGFGDSEEPSDSWSVEQYKVFFLHFLDALGITSCMLIGHSYGGRIIIRLAGAKEGEGAGNEKVDITKVILIDSAGVLPLRTAKQKRKQRAYKILKALFNNKVIYFLFDEIIDDWKSRQGSEDYRNATPVMKRALVKAVNEDLTDYLPGIKVPVLLVWGDEDTATPMRDARIMEEKIPDAVLKVIPGTGHFSYAENFPAFAGIINEYLRE